MNDASSTYVKNCHKKRSSDEKLADRIVNNYQTFSNYQKLSKLYTHVFDPDGEIKASDSVLFDPHENIGATEPPKSRPQDEISNNINQQSSL
ncbi:hypothetical protein F8M41_017765 [Gigaspora margarita]|uniref:Uncharacterized protein n=1 Tax=Gigaspora margarita TaxID=4874 RepID=A0A8H4ELV4_GIGMA|nr:hypothetical protein F8M41_017765 [Gigaspora margarita]